MSDLNPSLFLVMGQMHDGMSDHDFMHEEMRLAIAAEQMNFRAVYCVEHHFDRPYSMCPDNFMYLTYLAAKTTTMKIGIGACILPWNDPLRVSEKINLLDILSNGRLEMGFGRGLSRKEYAGFGIDMEEARERWNEAYDMVSRAQETGFAEGDGKFWKQPRTEIAPFSGIPLKGRTTEIAMSEESQLAAARLGLKMASFVQFPFEQHAPVLAKYRDLFQSVHGQPAPPPAMVDLVTIHEDAEEAERLHREAIGIYFMSLVNHYELMGKHFANTKGYESYDQMATAFREAGVEAAVEGYVHAQTHGTPEQVLERLRHNLDVAGDYDLWATFSIGGRPYAQVESMMRLWGDKVNDKFARMREQLFAAV